MEPDVPEVQTVIRGFPSETQSMMGSIECGSSGAEHTHAISTQSLNNYQGTSIPIIFLC